MDGCCCTPETHDTGHETHSQPSLCQRCADRAPHVFLWHAIESEPNEGTMGASVSYLTPCTSAEIRSLAGHCVTPAAMPVGTCTDAQVRLYDGSCAKKASTYEGMYQMNSCTGSSATGVQSDLHWSWNQNTSATSAAECKQACVGGSCSAYLYDATSSTCITASAACSDSDVSTPFVGQVKINPVAGTA